MNKAQPKHYDLNQTTNVRRLVGLWRMVSGYRWLYALALLGLGLAATALSASFYLLRFFVDTVLAEGRWGLLPWIAVGFVGLALVRGGLTFASGRAAAETAERVVQRLRDYLYDHLQRLSLTYHDRMQTGDLLQRSTSDVDALRRLFSEQLIGIGRIGTLFLVSLAALVNLHGRLALYSVVVIPVVIGISVYFFHLIGKAYDRYQQQEATLSTRLQENLSGVRVVKAFARQDYEIERFEDENHTMLRRGRGVILLHAAYWPVTDLLCAGQMLAGFYLGATMAIAGNISVGTYIAYAGLVVQIIWPIRNLGRIISQMSTGFVSFDRIRKIMEQTREPLDDGVVTKQALRGAVAFEHVDFAYETSGEQGSGGAGEQGSKGAGEVAVSTVEGREAEAGARPTVLRDISFAVEPGQVVALMGPAGSGKSSLVNLLPRFYDYTSGRITVDGVELRSYSRAWLRKQIGIVQQEPFLFSRTIRDNIAYGVGRDVTQDEIEHAARAAAIHEVIVTFPQGYDTPVGERGVTLSGGQKQRITIARTLLKDPRILVLDDATSSVDTETEATIRGALQELMVGRTTFIIAHRITSVLHADLILVLDHGRIQQRGTHEELIAQAGVYREIFELQGQIEEELQQEIAAAERDDFHSTYTNGTGGERVLS